MWDEVTTFYWPCNDLSKPILKLNHASKIGHSSHPHYCKTCTCKCDIKREDLVKFEFCIWRDSWAVVTCAKWSPDRAIIITIEPLDQKKSSQYLVYHLKNPFTNGPLLMFPGSTTRSANSQSLRWWSVPGQCWWHVPQCNTKPWG